MATFTAREKTRIRNLLQSETLMEPTFHKDGFITAQRKFRALQGRTSEMYARKIEEIIPNAKVMTHDIDPKTGLVRVKFKIEGGEN